MSGTTDLSTRTDTLPPLPAPEARAQIATVTF